MDGGSGDLLAAMTALGLRARAAAADLACADPARKTAALHAAADAAQARRAAILAANARDMEAAADKGLSPALLDRLMLDEKRINGLCDGLRAVAEQPDPVGGDRGLDAPQRPAHPPRASAAGRDRRDL